jgi:hypothetical protein
MGSTQPFTPLGGKKMKDCRKNESVFDRIIHHLNSISSMGIVPEEVMLGQYSMVEEMRKRREELARAVLEADLLPVQAELDTAVWSSNNPNVLYHPLTDNLD